MMTDTIASLAWLTIPCEGDLNWSAGKNGSGADGWKTQLAVPKPEQKE